MKFRIIWVWALLPTLFFACQRENIDVPKHPVFEQLPEAFPQVQYTFPDAEQQYHWFELGRRLFYDPILSKDSTIACASCHRQEHAFADTKALSLGINAHHGRRNSPALQNLAYSPTFMMDGGILHLETMPLAPITDTLEMGISIADLVSKLNKHTFYKNRFSEITKKDSVSSKDMLWALTAFQSGIHSYRSLYDSIQIAKANWKNESQAEGYKIFMEKCSKCHHPPLFTDFTFSNNGYNNTDIGRNLITGQVQDLFRLKVPSLRNINMSAPYMHDGGLADLDAVLAHYQNLSGDTSNTLDPRLRNLSLNDEEVEALKQFLCTLTDYELLRTTYYAAPK